MSIRPWFLATVSLGFVAILLPAESSSGTVGQSKFTLQTRNLIGGVRFV
jgi:hypothetical protein